MHPAHEGLSAMPFYDDFDLSTVDVLLISQYVYAHFACYGSWDSAHHWSRALSAHIGHSQFSDLYISINGILFASSSFDFDDVPFPDSHPCI